MKKKNPINEDIEIHVAERITLNENIFKLLLNTRPTKDNKNIKQKGMNKKYFLNLKLFSFKFLLSAICISMSSFIEYFSFNLKLLIQKIFRY